MSHTTPGLRPTPPCDEAGATYFSPPCLKQGWHTNHDGVVGLSSGVQWLSPLPAAAKTGGPDRMSGHWIEAVTVPWAAGFDPNQKLSTAGADAPNRRSRRSTRGYHGSFRLWGARRPRDGTMKTLLPISVTLRSSAWASSRYNPPLRAPRAGPGDSPMMLHNRQIQRNRPI